MEIELIKVEATKTSFTANKHKHSDAFFLSPIYMRLTLWGFEFDN